ncbi:hypothetical protein SGPA1_21397 [Streptomyces misionensis JCM 4497]
MDPARARRLHRRPLRRPAARRPQEGVRAAARDLPAAADPHGVHQTGAAGRQRGHPGPHRPADRLRHPGPGGRRLVSDPHRLHVLRGRLADREGPRPRHTGTARRHLARRHRHLAPRRHPRHQDRAGRPRRPPDQPHRPARQRLHRRPPDHPRLSGLTRKPIAHRPGGV